MNGDRLADRLAGLVESTDAALDARIRQLELERRRVEADLAEAIAVAEARQLCAVDGHRSTASYLRATCNWSNAEISRFRSAARLIDRHEPIGDAWHDGTIGTAQVHELAKVHGNRRVTERLGEFVPMLLEQAAVLPHREFQILLSRFVQLADQDGCFDDRDAVDQRTANVTEVDGQLHVTAAGGDRLTTAEFVAIFERYVDREFQRDLAARRSAVEDGAEPPERRTRRQLRFDALLAMARSAADHDGLATPAEPLVSILVDHRTMSWVIAHSGLGSATSLTGESIDPFTGLPRPADLLADLLGDPESLPARRCETADGIALSPTDVLRAALSGHLRRVVLGAQGRPIDLGRSSRVFTGPARDAARLLIATCEHPGCDLPASWCQVDHTTEWVDHGETNQDNAGIRCGPHNRHKHRHRWRTRRATDGRAHTFRADGTIVLPVGHPPPQFPDDDDDDVGWLDMDELTPEQERAIDDAIHHRLALALAADTAPPAGAP